MEDSKSNSKGCSSSNGVEKLFNWEKYFVKPEVPYGGRPYNHQFTRTGKKYIPPPASPPRIIVDPKTFRPQSLSGGIHESWAYDCDGPFSTAGGNARSDLVSLCDAALEEYKKKSGTAYTYVSLLKAHSTSIGPYADFDIVFTAVSSSYCLRDVSFASTFEASVRDGVQFHEGKRGYSKVVQNVSIGRGSLFPHWIIGEYPRKCVYDSDVRSPYYYVDPKSTELYVNMSKQAIQHFNFLKSTNYECVQLPLRVFYWKQCTTQYFDVRFLASSPQTSPEIFEANLYLDEQVPGSWMNSQYCLSGVSRGCGSLFKDYI